MARILLFAQARDAAGCGELAWPIGEARNEEALWAWLIDNHPSLAALQSHCRIACNGAYSTRETLLLPGDDIPPVSGG